MEAIAAIASIIQIAQLGAQLSITLYNVAGTVGSANKDVQYVAKDIAFFSAVLKDLGKTLGKGQKLRLYREDAYKTSLLIVKECESVFGEIKEILKKSSKDGVPLDAGSPLPRIEKFLWIFRKSRVQLLRGNLESLKSTITLQLAVLNYADRVSSPSGDDIDSADELLTLKSLVLANETAKRDFKDLLSKSIQDSQSEEASTDPTDIPNGRQETSSGDPHVPAVSNHNVVCAIATTSKPSSAVGGSTSQGTLASKSPMSSTISFNPSELTTRYAQIWGLLDRLEFALRKVELARWEHERIQDNLLSGLEDRPGNERQEVRFLQRLERDLLQFGLSSEKVDQAIASLKAHHTGARMRAEVTHVVSKNEQMFEVLHSLGASWDIHHENPDCCIIKRWIPGYLEDILWEHTCQLLSTSPNEELNQSGSHEIIVSKSTPRSNGPSSRLLANPSRETLKATADASISRQSALAVPNRWHPIQTVVTCEYEKAQRNSQTANPSTPPQRHRKHSGNGIIPDRLQISDGRDAANKVKADRYTPDVDDTGYEVRNHSMDQKRVPKSKEKRDSLRGRIEKATLATKVKRFFGESVSAVPKLPSPGASRSEFKRLGKTSDYERADEKKILESKVNEEAVIKAKVDDKGEDDAMQSLYEDDSGEHSMHAAPLKGEERVIFTLDEVSCSRRRSAESPSDSKKDTPLPPSLSVTLAETEAVSSDDSSPKRKSFLSDDKVPVVDRPLLEIYNPSGDESAQMSVKADIEKRVGRRRGPLKPDQRKQAAAMRKLGATLHSRTFLDSAYSDLGQHSRIDWDSYVDESAEIPLPSDQGTQEKKAWFPSDNDKTSQVVEDLLRKWTFLDER